MTRNASNTGGGRPRRAVRLGLAFVVASAGCVSGSHSADRASVGHVVHARMPTSTGEEAEAARATFELPAADEADGDDARSFRDASVDRVTRGPLSLDDAIRVALLNNREVRAELHRLGIARGQLVQASLFPNPDFEAQMRIPEGNDQSLQWDFGVGIDLTHIILRGASQDVMEAELEAARVATAGRLLDFAYRVRLAYYEVQARQQLLANARAALDAQAASFDATRTLFEAGNLTELDLANDQAAYETARMRVAEEEAFVVVSRERLNVLMGLFGQDTVWQLEAPLADAPEALGDLERLESRALEASLELASTRAQMNALGRRLGLTETRGWVPEINLGVHAEHDGTAWEAGPSLTGRLPLFDHQEGNLAALRAELAALADRGTAQAIEVRAAVRAARAQALSAQARAHHLQRVVLPLRARVLELSVLQYNAMNLGVFQLLEARRAELEANQLYVRTLLEYWRARARLEQLLAGRLAGPLAMDDSAPQGEPSSQRHDP